MMCSGTASFPMSWSTEAACSASSSLWFRPRSSPDLDGVDLHALQVVVRGVVLGVDGQGQRLDGSQVQRRHLFGVIVLVVQPAQIQPVGAVDQVDDGNDQHRALPSEVAGSSR